MRKDIKVTGYVRKCRDVLLDWIYPRRCVFCDSLLGAHESHLCAGCRQLLPTPIQEPRCKKCGKPLAFAEQEYCYDCSQYDQKFDRGMGIYLYQEPLKGALMRFKFKGHREYGAYFGKLMCRYGKSLICEVHPEVILPVPVHKRKKNIRGYNQAEVLAKAVSRGFSIPVRTDLVLRKKFTKAQKELDRKERKRNLEQAFYVKKDAGQYKSVLIVDDIFTTGSTMNAIAGKLKKQGVQRVFFLSLCIGKGF
jgi:ComF family protein